MAKTTTARKGGGAVGRIAGPLAPPTRERIAAGKALRASVPRETHAGWTPPPDRLDPIALLEEQGEDRLQPLLPVRYGRMVASPFAFLRGSAIVMAEDLSGSPSTGIEVQACGDAHLANFGLFATPERNLVFDLNDFDETLRAPWEWDVKRLGASIVVAGRDRGFTDAQSRSAALGMVAEYARWIGEFAAMRRLDVWYARIDVDALLQGTPERLRAPAVRVAKKARTRDSLKAQAKLTEVVDGHRRIRHDPPLVISLRENALADPGFVRRTFLDYLRTLDDDRRHLLSHYRFRDVALKVVGVGSVGTRCLIVLLEGDGDQDPLFLQIKEATASVLERHHRKSRYRNRGQRVVQGQRLTQAASDIFLGWNRARGEEHRHFYWRQLMDMKGSVDFETFGPETFAPYARLCGAALARAHARSGDAAAITGYIGKGTAFPAAIAAFSEAYADQTERDHAALVDAAQTGRLEAREGV